MASAPGRAEVMLGRADAWLSVCVWSTVTPEALTACFSATFDVLSWRQVLSLGLKRRSCDYLSACLSIYLGVYLCQSVCPSSYMYICLYSRNVCSSKNERIYISISLYSSMKLSIYLPIYLFIYLIIYPFIYLSVYLC